MSSSLKRWSTLEAASCCQLRLLPGSHSSSCRVQVWLRSGLQSTKAGSTPRGHSETKRLRKRHANMVCVDDPPTGGPTHLPPQGDERGWLGCKFGQTRLWPKPSLALPSLDQNQVWPKPSLGQNQVWPKPILAQTEFGLTKGRMLGELGRRTSNDSCAFWTEFTVGRCLHGELWPQG